jgi:mannose-6-phosphate isomerase-like protein (cupin superfamily)
MSVIHASALEDGSLEGGPYGATISLIVSEADPGQGPRLHRHAYDETWVVEHGTLSFQIDDRTEQAVAGDIVIVGAGRPHKFINAGNDRCRLICIHASPTIRGEWLE